MFLPYYHVEHLCYMHLMGNRIIKYTKHTHFCRNFVAKSATLFSENEGGGQRPFGTFPKIHPFRMWQASLMYMDHVQLYIESSYFSLNKPWTF